MATYVNDLRLKEIATGDEAGTWGTSTNTNLELIAEAFSFGTEAITTNADTHTTTIADGSTDPGRSIYLKYTGTLDSACTITIGPNTVSKLWFIENGTSGSQNIIISQGSGANVTIPAGDVKAVYSDGAGSGAAMVDAFASLSVVDLKVQDDLTVTDDLIVNGDIDLEGNMDVNGSLETDALSLNGTTVTSTAAEINLLDGSSANTVVNSKAVIYGSSGELAGTLSTAAQTNITSLGTLTTLTVDEITINGDTITATDDFIIDVTDDITLDADGGDIFFKDGGTQKMHLDGSGRLLIGVDSGDGFNDDAMLRLQRTGDRIFQSFKVDADQEAAIFFGDVDDDIECGIQYQAASKNLIFSTGNNSEAMRIDSSGNVGIGTTSPNATLNVNGTIRAENERFLAGRETASAPAYAFHDDADTGMFNVANNNLCFSTAGSERMRIDSNGKLLIGCTSDAVNVTGVKLGATGTGVFAFSLTSENESFIYNNNNSTGAVYKIDFRQNNVSKGTIGCSSSAVSFNTSSDGRLKNIIGEAKGLEIINKLNPVNFEWKETKEIQDGLIAQEVLDIVPNAVTGSEKDYYQMDYSKLVTPLIKAIQEQQEQIDALQSEINNLKGE